MDYKTATAKKQTETLATLSELIEERYGTSRKTLSFSPESPQPLRKVLESYNFEEPKPLKEVLLESANLLKESNLDTGHRSYFGLFNGPAHFSSVIADALVAAYNPQLSVWSHSAAANEIESHCIRFFLRRFGYGDLNGTSRGAGHFTSGGSESNTTALLCALNDQFPNFKREGTFGLKQRPLIYVSEYAHHSLKKAASAVGLGLDSIRVVPCDSSLKMDPVQLQQMIDIDSRAHAPFCIVATAGTTSAGVIDPLEEIAQIAQKTGLWFHIDAAWGGAAVFSEKLKPFLKGMECSDSITFDAHKWLSVSMGAGVFLTRKKSILDQTFGLQAEYMPAEVPDTSDLHKTSLQWSRRFIGLKVFFALAELGSTGLSKQIDHQTALGDLLRNELSKHDWIILNPTPLPVVCFTHPLIRAGKVTTQQVLQLLYSKQKHWISETKIGNETVFRACITHPDTTASEIVGLVTELASLI